MHRCLAHAQQKNVRGVWLVLAVNFCSRGMAVTIERSNKTVCSVT